MAISKTAAAMGDPLNIASRIPKAEVQISIRSREPQTNLMKRELLGISKISRNIPLAAKTRPMITSAGMIILLEGFRS
jgi:hypothetical protein